MDIWHRDVTYDVSLTHLLRAVKWTLTLADQMLKHERANSLYSLGLCVSSFIWRSHRESEQRM